MSQRESYLIFFTNLVKNGTIVIFLTFQEISGFLILYGGILSIGLLKLD